MPIFIRREIAQQIEPPMPRVTTSYAGVSLIDDHELLGTSQEFIAPLRRFDEIQTDDRERVSPEYALARRQVSLQTPSRRRRYSRRLDRELRFQLGHPLLHEVGGTEHRGAINLAAIIELTQDQTGLNGLSDSDVIGNQEADHIEL